VYKDSPARGRGPTAAEGGRPVQRITRGVAGTVRWFDPERGFGFLAPDGGAEDVFVHYSAIEGEGWRTLEPGARVRFDLVEGPRGPRADRVRPLPSLRPGPHASSGAAGNEPRTRTSAERPRSSAMARTHAGSSAATSSSR
jgi:CspA family cold shock protein